MAEEIIGVKVKVDAGDMGKSVGSLKQQLREAQNEVNALSEKFGATSKEAVNAAKKAAELKDAIGDAKALTDAFNPDAKFKALTATLSGVAGGFAAVQGAIGLMGVESEEVEKTLLKVQSAMAFSQGLQAVGESVDSFKQLGAVIQNSNAFMKINNALTTVSATVMKAFGFAVETTSVSFKVLKGAIAATGIGLLVVAVGELVNAFQNYTTAAERAKKAQDNLNKSISDSAKVGLEAEMQFIENQKQLDIAKAKNRGASEKEIFDIEQKYRKSKAESQIRYWKEIKNVDKEGAANAAREVEKINIEGSVAALDFDTKRKEKRAAENAKIAAEREAERKKLKEQREQEKKDYAEAQELIRREKQLAANLTKTEIIGVTAAGKDALIATQVTAKGVTNAILVSKDEQAEASRKLAEYEKKLQQDKFNAELGLASQSLQIIGGLVDQNSAAGKAIAVTQAIINTYQGASKAIAQGGIFGPVAAAATIAAGLINVRKIISTKVPSAKGTGSVADAGGGSMSMSSAPITPSAPIQNTVTQLDQGTINQMGSATGRAYVVESDITNQQEKIVRINRAARLG